MAVVAIDPEHACCARCSRLARYARDVADAMCLRDWAVLIDHDPSPAGTSAQVRMADDRRELAVAVCADWERLAPDEQRHALVHELVHPHLRDVWSSVEDGALEAFGGMAYRLYVQAVRRQVERSTDALAQVIAPYMPEPES